ncbi:hypothetical protein EXIGLDRAFT_769581 [Exidia glandulosa HHB12029]|uniref:Uncharacterized protein n=1 Tax=Exidia glandulosa HHB12029 TaxID=1314781 RepID=A0A165HDF2_EXIGL|nr:hypothetical protein EXIGLDRAFT_769581 [Exidia glandulosa HHB12029]
MSKSATLKRARPAADDPPSGGRRINHISRACVGCRARIAATTRYPLAASVPLATLRRCVRSGRVDKRRALSEAQVDELNNNIQQLEDVKRCMENENELLKYQIDWLEKEMRKHGIVNLAIPTNIPSSPALPQLSPGSSPSPSPDFAFFSSPASPSSSLPDPGNSPVDNKGLMLHGDPQLLSANYRPYALPSSLPDDGMYLSPMYMSGRSSTTRLPHPIPAFNSGFSTATKNYAGIDARAIHSAPPTLRITTASNDGITDITTMFRNAALVSPAKNPFALDSPMPPSLSSARIGPASMRPAFYTPRRSPTTPFDAFNTSSPSSSSFLNTPSSTTTFDFSLATLGHTTLLASPLSLPSGPSTPCVFEPPSYTGTNETAGADEGMLFRAERIKSRDDRDTLMKM